VIILNNQIKSAFATISFLSLGLTQNFGNVDFEKDLYHHYLREYSENSQSEIEDPLLQTKDFFWRNYSISQLKKEFMERALKKDFDYGTNYLYGPLFWWYDSLYDEKSNYSFKPADMHINDKILEIFIEEGISPSAWVSKVGLEKIYF
jgi:hypothetical protein